MSSEQKKDKETLSQILDRMEVKITKLNVNIDVIYYRKLQEIKRYVYEKHNRTINNHNLALLAHKLHPDFDLQYLKQVLQNEPYIKEIIRLRELLEEKGGEDSDKNDDNEFSEDEFLHDPYRDDDDFNDDEEDFDDEYFYNTDLYDEYRLEIEELDEEIRIRESEERKKQYAKRSIEPKRKKSFFKPFIVFFLVLFAALYFLIPLVYRSMV